MKRYALLATVACLGISSLTGCSSVSKVSKGIEAASKVAEENSNTSDKEDENLYYSYVDVHNYMTGQLDDCLNSYYNTVKYQEEFALINEDNYYCYSLPSNQIEMVDSLCETVNAKTEKTEMDEAFLALCPSYKRLIETLDKISNYIDLKSYLDDDYQKGKEMHAEIWSAYQEFEPLRDKFLELVEQEEEKQQEIRLNEYKENGMEVYYTLNLAIIQAKAIDDELAKEGVSDEDISSMNLEVIQPLYDDFSASVEQLQAYSEDKEKLKNEGIMTLSFVMSAAKDTKTSLAELIHKAKNGETTGENSISSFYDGLDDMIDKYNRL